MKFSQIINFSLSVVLSSIVACSHAELADKADSRQGNDDSFFPSPPSYVDQNRFLDSQIILKAYADQYLPRLREEDQLPKQTKTLGATIILEHNFDNLVYKISVAKLNDKKIFYIKRCDKKERDITFAVSNSPFFPVFYGAIKGPNGSRDSSGFMILEDAGEILQDKISTLNSPQIEKIFADIAAGLVHLHDLGFVHLDLRTANIAINKDGHARIIDFGTALKQNLNYLPPYLGIGAIAPPELYLYADPKKSIIYPLDTKYDPRSVDIYQFAYVYLESTSMLPTVQNCSKCFYREDPVLGEKQWLRKLYPELISQPTIDYIERQNKLPKHWPIVKKMLSENPGERPTAKDIADEFSYKDPKIN